MADYQWDPLTDEKKFEDLINDLCSVKYGLEFQIYGRKGQKQYGIDGFALTQGNKHILYQCKNKDTSRANSTIQAELLKNLDTETSAMIKEFIEKKIYIIDRFIFANSFKRDTKLQDKATELSLTHGIVVIVWSWDEISDMLEEYTDIAQKYYPQSFNKNSNKLPPHLTTKLGKSTLIGREKELQEIDERLKTSKTLLVKGIGGVGKSTIVSNYLHRHKDEYDYYGFFEGLESFETELEGAFKLEIEQGQDRLDRVLRELIKLEPEGNKLLVIDDVQEIKENQEKLEKILELKYHGYRVLLTSRFKIKNVEIYSLPTLDPLDAQKLFLDNYKTEELEKVNQITEYLDYHPLFVELVAKTIKNDDYSLDEIIEKFELGELAKIEFIDEEEGDAVSFNQNLQKLFEMQKKSLKDEYLLLLKQLAVLPSIDIELSLLENIFDRRLKGRLNFLVAQGWLISNDESYKLHKIIKIFFFKEEFIEYKDVTFILENIAVYITPENLQTSINTLSKYIPIIKSILSIFANEEDEYIIGILDSITFLYHSLGQYDKALAYQNNALDIRLKLYGEKSEHTATGYNILGLIQHSKLNLDDALSLYIKSTKIWEDTLDSNHKNLSIAYNNLSGLYENISEYEKALKFANLSLNINKKIYGLNHLQTAITYNMLGEIYDSLENWDKALFYYELSLEIRVKELGVFHEYTAISYNNLAVTYENIKDYKKALLFYEKSLNIREKVLGKEHPLTGDSYSNIGLFYKKRRECNKAEIFMCKAIDVYKQYSYQFDFFKASEEYLKEIRNLIKKEKKVKFKDKGRHCI